MRIIKAMKKTQIFVSLTLILSVLILVIIREIKSDYARLSVEEVHQISLDESVFITLNNLSDNKTVIILDTQEPKLVFPKNVNILHLKASELLEAKNKKKLKQLEGNFTLYSNNINTASSCWVALTSLGYTHVKILINTSE